jgi:hypothetical protein
MRLTRRRWTWLGPIRAFLAISIIIDFLGIIVGTLQLFNGAYPIGTVMFGDLFPQGIPNFNYRPLSFGYVEVMGHPTGAFQTALFGLSHGLGPILATLPMLIYAYHVTDEALRNDPFTLTMVRKLRKLGLVILVCGLVSEVVAFVAAWVLLDDVLSDQPALLREGANLELNLYPTLWWLVPGCMVLAFAAVVQRGCSLRAELDEVI